MVSLDDVADLQSSGPGPDRDYEQDNQVRALVRLIRDNLTPRQAIFAELVWIRGGQRSVVASQVGCAPANVTQILNRSLDRLAPLMEVDPSWRTWLERWRRRNNE
jgi:hypothetical protein